jgi:hypothetical protein
VKHSSELSLFLFWCLTQKCLNPPVRRVGPLQQLSLHHAGILWLKPEECWVGSQAALSQWIGPGNLLRCGSHRTEGMHGPEQTGWSDNITQPPQESSTAFFLQNLEHCTGSTCIIHLGYTVLCLLGDGLPMYIYSTNRPFHSMKKRPPVLSHESFKHLLLADGCLS